MLYRCCLKHGNWWLSHAHSQQQYPIPDPKREYTLSSEHCIPGNVLDMVFDEGINVNKEDRSQKEYQLSRSMTPPNICSCVNRDIMPLSVALHSSL